MCADTDVMDILFIRQIQQRGRFHIDAAVYDGCMQFGQYAIDQQQAIAVSVG